MYTPSMDLMEDMYDVHEKEAWKVMGVKCTKKKGHLCKWIYP